MASVKLSAKAVGSTVKLKVGGTYRDFIVVHQGLPGSMYDASCNGTWLLEEVGHERRNWHSSNVNDYANSDVHAYLNGDYLNQFDAGIRSIIMPVKVPYVKGDGKSGTICSGSDGLPCRIFLLSSGEVGHRSSDISSVIDVGNLLSYFIAGQDTTAMNKRRAKGDGSSGWVRWWNRSPLNNTSYECLLLGTL